MFRAISLAVGAGLLILGLESLAVDHAVLAADSPFVKKAQAVNKVEPVYDDYGFQIGERSVASSAPTIKKISPPEWAPWSMLSSGAVILLYAVASRFGSREE